MTENEHQPGEQTPDDVATLGDPRVAAAVARTSGLEERPVGEHVAIFEDVHRRFRDALDDPAEDA